MIEWRQWLVDVVVFDFEEAYEYAYINHYGYALNEEYGSILVGSGVTEEVEYMKKAMKSSSLSSYMLKPSHLLTQRFENNSTVQDKLFKHMCNIGERE